jgi:putative FmdB family regulatory protein
MEVVRKMPTYDYECKKCGHTSEVFHTMTAKPRVKCPECGASAKKLIGAGAGIIFKGSGFYETDYKRKSGSNGGGTKAPPPKSESKSESKKEVKSERSDKN